MEFNSPNIQLETQTTANQTRRTSQRGTANQTGSANSMRRTNQIGTVNQTEISPMVQILRVIIVNSNLILIYKNLNVVEAWSYSFVTLH
jgi:hypothetical protein